MLEDPSHQDVARWGKDGDSFVVVEVCNNLRWPYKPPIQMLTPSSQQGEKFTRSILPKHFKHSNMSSFIRQLNKYDFHKVKPSADLDGTAPAGNVRRATTAPDLLTFHHQTDSHHRSSNSSTLISELTAKMTWTTFVVKLRLHVKRRPQKTLPLRNMSASFQNS